MHPTTLFRLAAACAIAAGALRVIAAFAGPRLDPGAAEVLYLLIDLGFVFALPGLYLSRCEQLGPLGFGGFVASLGSAAFIAGPDSAFSGVDMYMVGGGVLLAGLAILAAAQLRAGAQRIASSAGWLTALAAALLAALTSAAWLFTVTGVLLGLAFIAAGVELLRERQPHDAARAAAAES